MDMCMPAVCGYDKAVAAGTYAGVGSPGLVWPPRRVAAGANRGQGCCADREYCTAVQARGDFHMYACAYMHPVYRLAQAGL